MCSSNDICEIVDCVDGSILTCGVCGRNACYMHLKPGVQLIDGCFRYFCILCDSIGNSDNVQKSLDDLADEFINETNKLKTKFQAEEKRIIDEIRQGSLKLESKKTQSI